jgi:excisionase family DNA binding protein
MTHKVNTPQDREMEKLLLTPAEVAATLGIGRTRVYEMLARGELPQMRIGRSIRVPRHALARWVDERSAVHGAPPSDR